LKFFYRFERDVYGCALAAELLAEEAVVVVAAIESDVIEDSALAREIDLVAVGPLRDADVSRSSNFLPRIGVVLTANSFSVVLASVFDVSTVGVVVTSTVPSTSPTPNEKGICNVWPTVSAVLSTAVVLKPVLEAVTE
jgi:hypothetical protein